MDWFSSGKSIIIKLQDNNNSSNDKNSKKMVLEKIILFILDSDFVDNSKQT